MSKTTKREYHRPDGWHLGKRLERKARPAGRHAKAAQADLALDEEVAQ